MIEIKAPDKTDFQRFARIFLAGSISGATGLGSMAENWQEKVSKELIDEKVILYNPRRDDWDSSWVQDPTPGTYFHEQVSWELDSIEKSDLVVFYFDPETQSPITLLELGCVIGSGKRFVVCCPDGYFRKGNVVITCRRAGVFVCNNFEQFMNDIRKNLIELQK